MNSYRPTTFLLARNLSRRFLRADELGVARKRGPDAPPSIRMPDARKILDIMTFVEWQVIVFFGNIGLPKRRPNSGHVSPTTNPTRNESSRVRGYPLSPLTPPDVRFRIRRFK